MHKYLSIYFLSFLVNFFAQNKSDFIWPLETPHALTANYGQLRANHFHAGIDLSTNGANLPVHAAEEGYVSRIKVSGYGYGKCVYITHANGKVTVYGHLNAYSLKIDTLIKREQRLIQSYEIDCYPKQRLYVNKGEIIGVSGNTGGSTGPHLHFEIRDELTEIPLNSLNYYKINDNVKPTLQAIALFNLSDTLNPKCFKTINIKEFKGQAIAESASITINHSIIGFAFSGFDKNYNGGHLNNIYSAKLYFDEQEIYTHLLQAVSFDESRYVNQYAEASNGRTFQKCFLPELAPADFVMNSSNQTRIVLKDTNYHIVKMIVTDESGNTTHVQFKLKTKQFSNYHSNISQYDCVIDCKKDLLFSKKELTLQCPAYTFFISTPLTIVNNLESTGNLSILPSDVNLKSPLQLRFKTPEKYLATKEFLILRNNGNTYTPTVHGDSISYGVKNLGWYQIDKDLTAPIVQFVNTSKTTNPKSAHTISFIIKDNMSGIGVYKLYINNQWVLAEFDAKNDLLTYKFDKDTPSGNLDIRLEVFDKVGNKTTKSFELKK